MAWTCQPMDLSPRPLVTIHGHVPHVTIYVCDPPCPISPSTAMFAPMSMSPHVPIDVIIFTPMLGEGMKKNERKSMPK